MNKKESNLHNIKNKMTSEQKTTVNVVFGAMVSGQLCTFRMLAWESEWEMRITLKLYGELSVHIE